MSGLRTRAWPGAGRSWGCWVGPRLRLGPAVLLSAGALLGLSAAGVTVASAPARAGVVKVVSGPALLAVASPVTAALAWRRWAAAWAHGPGQVSALLAEPFAPHDQPG